MRKHSIPFGLCFVVLILLLAITASYKSMNRPTSSNRLKLVPRQSSAKPAEPGKVHAQGKKDSNPDQTKQSGEQPTTAATAQEVENAPQQEQPVVNYTPENPAVVSVPMPSEVKGVYSTGWIAGSSKFFPRLLEFINRTEVNSLVVDVKDDMGTFSYKSQVPLALQTGAGVNKVRDMVALLKTLKEQNVYPIARIVVFKDPHLAEARPDLAIKSKSGGLWKDHKGMTWVDPYSREVWKYTVDAAEEAIALGFKEIQFDYVRFASDGKIADCVFPFADGKSKEDTIKEFLVYAGKRLKRYDAVISADVFGLVCSAEDDLGIGQKLEKIGAVVDILSPMVYPSHYYKGTYGLANPDTAPYETITKSMMDAKKKLAGINVGMRPWLQDFNLGSKYGREQILAQIKALNDQGIHDWLFWNPSCRYDVDKYPAKQ